MKIKQYIMIVILLITLIGCSRTEVVISADPATSADASQSSEIDTFSSQTDDTINPWVNAETILEFSSDKKEVSALVQTAFSSIMKEQFPQLAFEIVKTELYGTVDEFAAEITFTVPNDGNSFAVAGEAVPDGKATCIKGVRARKTDESKYAVIGFGNGGIAIGLNKI